MRNLSEWPRSKGQAVVSYLPVLEEVQCYLNILQFVESHSSLFSGLRDEGGKKMCEALDYRNMDMNETHIWVSVLLHAKGGKVGKSPQRERKQENTIMENQMRGCGKSALTSWWLVCVTKLLTQQNNTILTTATINTV